MEGFTLARGKENRMNTKKLQLLLLIGLVSVELGTGSLLAKRPRSNSLPPTFGGGMARLADDSDDEEAAPKKVANDKRDLQLENVQLKRALGKAFRRMAHDQDGWGQGGWGSRRRRRSRGFFNDGYGYGGYGYGWDGRDFDGKGYAKRVCIKQIAEIGFGEDGEKLKEAFNGENGSFWKGMGTALGWDAIIAGTSGFIGAAERAVEEGGQSLLGAIGTKIKDAYTTVVRALFHRGADPVEPVDIGRWGKTIKNIFDGFKALSEKAKASAHINTDMSVLFQGRGSGLFPSFDDDKKDGEDETKGEIFDTGWAQNAKLYLSRIRQIVNEIDARRRHYSESEEIVFCLDQLKIALIGDAADMVTVNQGEAHDTVAVTRNEEGKIVQEWKAYGGGIYACIKYAKSLADLSASETEITMELFRRHIIGLLTELQAWVTKKNTQSSFAKKKVGLGGGYGTGGYGSDGWGLN